MTVYLDNAASSCPKPAAVVEAVKDCLENFCANPGRGAHKLAVAAARIIFQARAKAAGLLGVEDSANVIFTQNATDSLNIALHGLLSPGDHVVTSVVEHNAVLRPLMVLARGGVGVSFAGADPAGRVDPEEVLALLGPNTRLVVLSQASNVSGAITPVAEVSAALNERGVPLLIDAAQSGGSLPLDIKALPASIIALTGHKGLMGPQGIGLLYVPPDIELRSLRQGGTGTRSEEEQDALGRPDRYESGTLNTPGIAGLAAGIDFLEREGLEKIARHKAGLVARLHAGLAGLDNVSVYGPKAGEPRAPLVAFNVGDMTAADVAARLDCEHDIASRAGLHCAPGAHRVMGTLKRGAVRLSVGPFNSSADIDAAIEAVAGIASQADRKGRRAQ